MEAATVISGIEANRLAVTAVTGKDPNAEIAHGLKVGIGVSTTVTASFLLAASVCPGLHQAFPQLAPALPGIITYLIAPGALLAYCHSGLPQSTTRLFRVCAALGAVAAGFTLYII